MFLVYSLFAHGEGNEGMRKVTRQPDGQPIEARPGFFLREMGQNLLTRIESDATTKISNMKFEGTWLKIIKFYIFMHSSTDCYSYSYSHLNSLLLEAKIFK